MDEESNLCYDSRSLRNLPSANAGPLQECPVNTERLRQILRETTTQLRKGEVIEGTPALAAALKTGDGIEDLPSGSVHIYGMPHVREIENEGIEKVDCHFIVIGVNKAKAESHRAEVVTLLGQWPTESWGQPTRQLTEELNYIEVGSVLGDQGAALCLFALGQTLRLWKVLTPKVVLGVTGPTADMLAGRGYITISGLKLE